MWLRFLALVCLVGAALAGPVQRLSKDESSKGIDPSHQLLHIETGKIHRFHMELKNTINYAKGYTQTEAIEGIVELNQIFNSGGYLVVKNVKIKRDIPHSEDDELIEKLKVLLEYGYADGNFEHVCPSSKESKESLNLKNAILSALINNIVNDPKSQTVKEVDSLGNCRTEYTVQEDEVISKRKDMSTCTGRSSKNQFSNFFTRLLVKEHRWECNQTFKDGTLESVDCLEKKSMINLPNDTPVLDLTGNLKLVHIETKPSKIQPREKQVNKCEKIYYEIDDFHHEEKNVEKIKNIFRDICSKTDEDFYISSSQNFMKLVSLIKKTSYPALVELHKFIKDGSMCSSRKLLNWFGDALLACGNVHSVNVMIKMLGTDDVTAIQKNVLLPKIALLSNPDEHTMEAITLLMEKDQSPITTTVCGAVMHTFCKSNDCEQTQCINEFIAKQNENLGTNCSSDDYQQILTTLRLLGNIGYHGKAHRNIKACIKDRSKPIGLRLAAVHSCRNTNDDKMLPECHQILDKKDENTEIKIECISHILKHGKEEDYYELKSKLEKEKNMQVSSFMDTCIKNIQKTKDPIYIKAKKILKDYKNSHRNENSSTCSRNIVYSHFIKATKTYLVWETNVVCSNKSNVPIFISTHIRSGRTEIVQMRLRSEGYENTLEHFLAMTERKHDLKRLLHKIAQKKSLDELKKAAKEILNEMHLDKVFGSSKRELTFSLSITGIEIISVCTSDLSSKFGVLKFAEFLPKLPYIVESSHSFPLFNHEMIVPSITGRRYKFKLAGSATVGLTAHTKANTVNSQHFNLGTLFNPRFSWNMDIDGGIESNRIKQRMSTQVEVNVAIKSEVSKAGFSCEVEFPTKKPLMFRLSTECSRLDKDKQELSLYGEKETKIDKCFDPMIKLLGIAPCVKIEAPKGQMAINSMSTEIAFRTFDAESYLFKVEIPKKNASSRKYSTSIDTPHSKIPRRFEALLEVKSQRDQKDVLLEFKSPFETIGGSCSLMKNNENLETSLAIHTSKSQIASVTMSSRLISTRARKMLVVSGGYSLLEQKEKRINATFTKTNGRKHHVSFDVKSNSPESKPIAVKGTLMKEGIFELSPENEFKISSEISLQTPIGDIKLRKTLEKRSKQSQWLSANSVLEYQMREREKHSIMISTTSQKHSNKRHTVTSIVSTQYPAANMKMTWNSQKESQEIFNNDIKLQYGENQNETFVLFKHTTHIPKQGPGNCSINMEIPHRNWRRKVSFTHLLNLKSETPRAHFNFDISNEDDKRVRIGMDVECKSKSPLKASGRLELEYPDVHYIYEDKIEESSDNVIQGISKFQKKTGEKIKQSEIRYKYRKLSRGSKVHHEIESSIHSPLFKSPINGKASIELNRESLAISGHVGSHFSIEAHWKEHGVSHIHLKLPIIESKVNFTKKDTKSIINAVVETKRQQHVLEVMADCGNKKEFEFKYYPKNDRAPENQILVSISGERISRNSEEFFSGNSRLNIFNKVDVSLVEVGHLSLLGDHDLTLNIKNKDRPILTIKCERKVSNEKGTHTITIYERDIKKWSMEMESKLKQREHITDFSISVSVVKLHSNVFPNGLEVNTEMPDTHNKYEKNSVGLSLKVSDYSISSDVNVTCSDNNNISIHTKIETRDDNLILKSKIRFRNETFADVKVTVSKQSVEGQMDTKSGISGKIKGSIRKTTNDIQFEGSIQLHNLRDKKFREINTGIKFSGSKLSISGNIKQENDKNFSLVSEWEVKGNDIYMITNIDSPHKHWKDVKAHISVKCEASKTSISYVVDVNGKSKVKGEVTLSISSQKVELKMVSTRHNSTNRTVITANWKKTQNSFLATANIMKDTSSLLSTSLDLLSHKGESKLLIKTNYMDKSILHMELSKTSDKHSKEYGLKLNGPTSQNHLIFTTKQNDNNSISTEIRACRQFESKQECSRVRCHLENWSIQAYAEKSVGGSDYHPQGNAHLLWTSDLAKLIFMINENKRGIEFNLHRRKDENDPCYFAVKVYLPSCTSVFGASIYHNENNIKIKAYARPNTNDPKSNLEISINREYNPNSHEVTGLINITSKKSQLIAIKYTYGLVKGTDLALPLYFGKVVIYSGHDKTWTIEALPDIEQESSGKRRLVYRLSRNDKEIATLHLTYENTKDKKEIGCHWNYVTSGVVRERGLKVAVSRKNRGKAMKVSYSSPSAKYEVQTSISASPNEINFSLASSDRKIKEVNIKMIPSGIEVELKTSAESDSFIKFVILVDETGQNNVQLVKVVADYLQHNIFDIQVGTDPIKPYHFVFNIKYNKDVSREAWENFCNEFLPEVRFPEEVRKFKEIAVKKVKKLNLCLIEEPKCNLKNEVKEYIEKLMKHLQSAIPAPIKEVCKKLHEHLSVKAAIFYRKAKEIVSKYGPVICEAGWYCSDIKSAFENFDTREARVMIDRKVNEMKQLLSPRSLRLLHPSDFINFFKKLIQGAEKLPESITSPFYRNFLVRFLIKRVKNYITAFENDVKHFVIDVEVDVRQRILDLWDAFIKKVQHIFSEDENIQKAKVLILDAKDKMIKAWNHREEIATYHVRRVENSIKKLVDNHVEVSKYDPNRGVISFSVRPPSLKSDFEYMKHEFRQIFSKLKEFFNRNS